MVIGVDHAHLQGHFQDDLSIGIVQIENDIEDIASNRIDQNTSFFVVGELSN